MNLILTNATIVLPNETIRGTLITSGDRIADIQPGRSTVPGAIDLDGDFLLPGAVDLHTDNLERQVLPRAGTRWPARSAFLAHDSQCAAAGITTVLDSLCIGDLGFEEDRDRTCAEGIAELDALAPTGLLKCEHFLHLRCELPAIGMLAMLDRYLAHQALRLVSLMDHTPGSGQYNDLDRYQQMRARDGEPADVTSQRVARLATQRREQRDPNRSGVLARLRGTQIAVAGHDDSTAAEVEENRADGIRISEFPVTLAAAAAARAGAMSIIAGAPNLVRGGSHTGNVAASALLEAGLVDALASDYVPASLIHAAFVAADLAGLGLPRAVAMVSHMPAQIAGLADRGQLSPGWRADLVHLRLLHGCPAVRAVYRGGIRVA
jgi:alpha-D-ribose 1-methylphosphonate 5-triphosphate diphosphatase